MSYPSTRQAQLEATADSERLLSEDYTVKAKIARTNGDEFKALTFEKMARLCLEQASQAEQQKRDLENA